MNIEFHYYMTYLVAARAGLGPEDAHILAYSSQYTDDNTVRFEVDEGKASSYRNYITQTVNILKPKRKLLEVSSMYDFEKRFRYIQDRIIVGLCSLPILLIILLIKHKEKWIKRFGNTAVKPTVEDDKL